MTYKPTPVPQRPDPRFFRDELNRIAVAVNAITGGSGSDPALEARVTQLEADVLQLQTDLAALTLRVDALEVLTAQHTIDIDQNTTDIGLNTAAIAANTAAIAALENRFPLTWDGVS